VGKGDLEETVEKQKQDSAKVDGDQDETAKLPRFRLIRRLKWRKAAAQAARAKAMSQMSANPPPKEGSGEAKQAKPKPKFEPPRLRTPEQLHERALDIYEAAAFGSTGEMYQWMNGPFAEIHTYRADDWPHFMAALDEQKCAVIRRHLAETCEAGVLERLRGQLPPALTQAEVEHAPYEDIAPGINEKDALSQIYKGGSVRGREAATPILEGKLEAAAKALAGPSIAKDPAALGSFVDVFNELNHKAIDRLNNLDWAMSQQFGRDAKPTAQVTYDRTDPKSIDAIIDTRFDGEKAGYLKQLAADGQSSPLWRAKLQLGLVYGSRAASHEEVMHTILEAPPELEHFGLTWAQFWDPIKDKVKSRLSGLVHHSLVQRLEAFSNVQLAEDEVRDAKQARAGALKKVIGARKGKDDVRKKAAKKAHSEAREKVELAEDKVKDAQIAYLVALIRNARHELHDLDPEAVEELREWGAENPTLRGRAADDPRVLEALRSLPRARQRQKPRNVTYLQTIIRGDADHARRDDLQVRGFHDAAEHLDEVLTAEAMVEREQTKKDKGKGKHHANLKSALMSMSHAARLQYLARVANATRAALDDDVTFEQALAALQTQLLGVGMKPKEAEELVALFRMRDAGDHYTRLRAHVLTRHDQDSDKFGDKALRLVAKLEGDELAQARADSVVMGVLRTCSQHDKIEAILGSLDALAKTDGPGMKEAREETELRPEHWATILRIELDKLRVPVPGKPRQHRNQIHMIAHRAWQAASRAEHKSADSSNPTTASAFIQAVAAGMGHKRYFSVFYPALSKAMNGGGPITVDHVLDEVLFHDGPLRLAGHGGPAFYTHVDKEDFVKAVLQTEGLELLDEWSNFARFKTGLAEAKRRDEGDVRPRGDEEQEEETDPIRHQRAFRHQFVLDVKDERKHLIKKAVGNGNAPAVLKEIRRHLRESAEKDSEFKDVLDEAGINTLYHRERMTFRSGLEQGERRERGMQLRKVSSKGTADAQNLRDEIADLRRADRDLQEVPVTEIFDGHAEDTEARHAQQDHLYESEHQERLAKDDKALERSGAAFTKLREKIRKYVELSITIAVMVIATAIAAAITAATWGAGSPTLAGAALLWAKFGVMMAAKLTAVVITSLLKEGVGNAITGEEFDGRRMMTGMLAGGAGMAVGGVAGVGVDLAIEAAGQITSVAAIEVLKVLAIAGAKSLTRQGIKFALEQNRGDITLPGTAIDLLNTELSSIAAGEVAAAIQLEQAAHDAHAHEEVAIEHLHEEHEALGTHEGGTENESDATMAEHLHDAGVEHMGEADTLVGQADGHLDTLGGTGDQELVAAHDEITQAHEALSGSPPDYEAAQEHLDLAQEHLESLHDTTTDPEALAQIEEAQAQLGEAQTQIGEGLVQIEAAEGFETAEADAQAQELLSARLAIVGQPTDWTVEQLLDFVLDKLEEAAEERINKAKELREEKLERAREASKERDEEGDTPHVDRTGEPPKLDRQGALILGPRTGKGTKKKPVTKRSQAVAKHPATAAKKPGEIVKDVVSISKGKGTSTQARKTTTETGIKNTGNSCYLAAGLNMLAFTEPYRRLFRDPRPEGDPLEPLRAEIWTILEKIRAGQLVDTNGIHGLLTELDAMGFLPPPDNRARRNDQTATTAQQDPSEVFFRGLIPTFAQGQPGLAVQQATVNDFNHTELTDVGAYNPASNRSELGDDRIIREAANPEWLIELPIDQSNNLQSALAAYQATEVVEERVKLGDREVKGNAQRHLEIQGTPAVITFALKRYVQAGPRGPIRKDKREVDMPRQLPFNGANYTLTSVIQHHGKTQTRGHYTATTQSDQGWQHRDDGAVSTMSEQEVDDRAKKGYLYTYVRQDG